MNSEKHLQVSIWADTREALQEAIVEFSAAWHVQVNGYEPSTLEDHFDPDECAHADHQAINEIFAEKAIRREVREVLIDSLGAMPQIKIGLRLPDKESWEMIKE